MCSFTIHSSNQGMRTLSSPKLKKKDFSPVICRAFSARLLVGTPRPGPPSQRGGRNRAKHLTSLLKQATTARAFSKGLNRLESEIFEASSLVYSSVTTKRPAERPV